MIYYDSFILKFFFYLLGKYLYIKEIIIRVKFEELNKDLFVKVLDLIRIVLKVIYLEKEDIDEIVLVGGLIRILMIRNLIREFFGKELNTVFIGFNIFINKFLFNFLNLVFVMVFFICECLFNE